MSKPVEEDQKEEEPKMAEPLTEPDEESTKIKANTKLMKKARLSIEVDEDEDNDNAGSGTTAEKEEPIETEEINLEEKEDDGDSSN